MHRLSPLGAKPQAIIERLDVEPDVSIRRALILTLGEFDDQQLLPTDQEQLAVKLLETYATDLDAGIHGASKWVLRRWGKDAQLKEKDHELATGKLEGNRQWYVNKQGQTLAVIPGPVDFVIGSPVGEVGREEGDHVRRRRGQFTKSRREHRAAKFEDRFDLPISFVPGPRVQFRFQQLGLTPRDLFERRTIVLDPPLGDPPSRPLEGDPGRDDLGDRRDASGQAIENPERITVLVGEPIHLRFAVSQQKHTVHGSTHRAHPYEAPSWSG